MTVEQSTLTAVTHTSSKHFIFSLLLLALSLSKATLDEGSRVHLEVVFWQCLFQLIITCG